MDLINIPTKDFDWIEKKKVVDVRMYVFEWLQNDFSEKQLKNLKKQFKKKNHQPLYISIDGVEFLNGWVRIDEIGEHDITFVAFTFCFDEIVSFSLVGNEDGTNCKIIAYLK